MGRILVIEDEEQVRAMIRQMLEREGHEVFDAPDGAVGIRLFRENPVDLIITDLLMPEKEGLETIKELREENPDLKIIAMSGGGQSGISEYLLDIAEQFGAAKTLSKPFQLQELIGAVEETLNETAS